MRISILTLSFSLLYFLANECARALEPVPDKLVVLGFDDCNKSDRHFVAEVLKKHGFGATFYVTEGLGFHSGKGHYITWEEIVELHKMGFEIGNHTKSHPNVTRLSRVQLKAELSHIEKRCREHGISKPDTFAFPGFSNNLRAVEVLAEMGYRFARRGVGPEYPDSGSGARGPAYDPASDHPLLIPTTGYAGPKWGMKDLQWAVSQAKGGKIAVLCFHGVPALDHPWVNCTPEAFRKYMQFLKDEGCTVIAMRDLARYVDSGKQPKDPYAPIRARVKK